MSGSREKTPAAGRSVLVVAGEVSGDMHTAAVVRAVRAKDPGIEFFGIGGEELRAAGVDIIYDATDMAVLGLAEVLKRYGFFKRVFNDMLDLIRFRRPDLVLLTDYPGFNLRFAREARQKGLRVMYYICPQVWAWHRSRIKQMAEVVNRLAVIFPFEPAVFQGTRLKVDFVGHPLVEAADRARAEPLKLLPWVGDLRVALLPGSREIEVRRMLPTMLSAGVLTEKSHPGASFIIASPTDAIAAKVREILEGTEDAPGLCEVVSGDTRQVLRQARAALVASGTATIETALMGCPMVVVYKTSWPTYLIGKILVQVPNLGMVNIVAGGPLCPEFIQHEATPQALAGAIEPLLGDTPERAGMVKGLEEVRKALGGGGAAERTADILLQELETSRVMKQFTSGSHSDPQPRR